MEFQDTIALSTENRENFQHIHQPDREIHSYGYYVLDCSGGVKLVTFISMFLWSFHFFFRWGKLWNDI